MKKWNKKYVICIALLASIIGMNIPSLYAANAIDPDRIGSLTINVSDTSTYGADIQNASIHVNLYKIADMDNTGAFTSTSNFSEMKIEEIPSGSEDWETSSLQAKQIVEEKQLDADGSFDVEDGSGSYEPLQHGLYLVLAQDTNTENYSYSFNPYIISIPDNYYYQTKDEKDDEWIYDVSAGLKPERTPRYGSLKIIKTLNAYNASLKETTFVFSVEGKDDDGNVVYSNVVSTTFDSTGSKEAILDQIPSGLHVTVKEVYSGASYTLVSDAEQYGTILADETIEVDFTNTYNDELKPGTGVTNHFDYSDDSGWIWTQQ